MTVVYAKNPISTYAGQSVKIKKKKDLVDFIKKFAIPRVWSIVEDLRIDKSYRVMKKSKQVMQIPIQSLNETHNKKFNFDFNTDIYKYYLIDEETEDIQLVLANGEYLILDESNSDIKEKKRDKK
jgi:hypothetical protein